MTKKITRTHRFWLLNVENSIFYRVPLEDVGVNAKRIDILFDMDLVQYGDARKSEPIYVLSDTGKIEVEKLKKWIAKERAKLKKA